MSTISLVMVLKDEAETIKGAIESVLPVVDEVVIGVDKSCKDNTAELAKPYASPGKYFEFDFNDDFSEIRNKAIERATGDVIFIMDGHEFVPPDNHPTPWVMARMRHVNPNEIGLLTPLSFLEQVREQGIPDPYKVICITLAMNTDAVGLPALFFLQPRLFENDGKIKYQNKVHNSLTGYPREAALGCPEGILIHNMPPEREKMRIAQRKKMNFSGLMKDVRDTKKLPLAEQDARPFFYMGNSHADMGHPSKAIYWYEQYLKRSKFGEEKYQALQQLAVLYFRHTEDIEKARSYAFRAMRENWRRCEPYILLGEIAQKEGDLDQSIAYFDRSEAVNAPHTVMFLQGPAYGYMPDIKRMLLYEEKEMWGDALLYAESALTWRPGDPNLIKKAMEYRRASKQTDKDRNLLMVDVQGSFTGDLAAYFQQSFTVARRDSCDMRWKGWADVAWFEWCDNNLIEWTQYEWDVPIICRLHSYEAFSDMPSNVNWSRVDHLIFVAEHIRALFFKKWPDLYGKLQTSVMPNGVNPESLTFRERGHGNKVGYLGYLNGKKGVSYLTEAAIMYPEMEFHIAGQFQDPHLEYDFKNTIAELHNVWFYGWIPKEQKDNWLEDMDYILSPSVVESFGYSIAEAMLKGIKPLVRKRPGAIWKETWRTVAELGPMFTNGYDSTAYRDHILKNHGIQAQCEQAHALVEYVIQRHKGNLRNYEREAQANIVLT